MRPVCSLCFQEISDQDRPIHATVGMCSLCHVQSLLTKSKPEDLTQKAPQKKKVQMTVAPEGLMVSQDGFAYTIQKRWWGPKFYFFLLFSGIWNSFLGAFVAYAWISEQLNILLHVSIQLLVGIGFGYYTLCGFINRTKIQVDFRQIQVSHGPLPCFIRNRLWDRAEILQLFVIQSVAYKKNGSPVYQFDLKAKLLNGSEVLFVGGFNSHEQALFVEQEVEQYLGIQDKSLAGEWHSA